MTGHEKAEDFIQRVRKIVSENYSTVEVAEDRATGGSRIRTGSNSVIASVFLQANKYNRHIEPADLRRKVEEIASIANGQEATALTRVREAREDSGIEFYEKYPGSIRILQLGGTENRGYPIFEVEYKYLNRKGK